MFFLVGSMNLFFCFFVTTSYLYRCIFFVLVLPYMFELIRKPDNFTLTKKAIYLFFILLTITIWNELLYGLLELTGKATNKIELMSTFKKFFAIVEQICAWGAITILIAFTLAILKKPAIEKLPSSFFKKTA